MHKEDTTSVVEFYRNQTVFLTGSTGGLGACLLYKLAIELQTPKIYVLVRGSAEMALQRWKMKMPEQLGKILASRSIIFVSGNMTMPQFGIATNMFTEIKSTATLVIHSAANISFKAPINRVVEDNCISSLELAKMASEFEHLLCFVQLSSAYANANYSVPDGLVEERIYPLGDPEEELSQVLTGCSSPFLAGFAWPYAYSKHLMERLLVKRFPSLPVLIVRPTSIGPAVKYPYELYGPKESCPVSTFYSRLMYPTGGINIWHAPKLKATGSNVVDEIPVDLVANILLQHAYLGTRGIVHASSLSYKSKTLDQIISDSHRWLPVEWEEKMAKNVFTKDLSKEQCSLAKFYRIGTRDWRFDNKKSEKLEKFGPIGLTISDHNIEDFTAKRVLDIFHDVKKKFETQEPKISVRASVSKL